MTGNSVCCQEKLQKDGLIYHNGTHAARTKGLFYCVPFKMFQLKLFRAVMDTTCKRQHAQLLILAKFVAIKEILTENQSHKVRPPSNLIQGRIVKIRQYSSLK